METRYQLALLEDKGRSCFSREFWDNPTHILAAHVPAGVFAHRQFEIGYNLKMHLQNQVPSRSASISSHTQLLQFFPHRDISWHAGPSTLHPVSFFSSSSPTYKQTRGQLGERWFAAVTEQETVSEGDRVFFDCCGRPHPRVALESPPGVFKRWRHDKGVIVERRLISVGEAAIFSKSLPHLSRSSRDPSVGM